jgi:hypothetical protein
MSLKKQYIRDGKNQIIGSVTSGFSDESTVVRDEHERIVGRTSERFHTTRDERGALVSVNTAQRLQRTIASSTLNCGRG